MPSRPASPVLPPRPPNRAGSVRNLPVVMVGGVPHVGFFALHGGHRPEVPLAVGVVGRQGLYHAGAAEVGMDGAERRGGGRTGAAAVLHQVACMGAGNLIVVRGVVASEGCYYGVILALDYHAGDLLTTKRLSRERYYAMAGHVCPEHPIDFPDFIRRPPARAGAAAEPEAGSPKGLDQSPRGFLADCGDIELVAEVCARGLFAPKDLRPRRGG